MEIVQLPYFSTNHLPETHCMVSKMARVAKVIAQVVVLAGAIFIGVSMPLALTGCVAAYAGYKMFFIKKIDPSNLPKGLVNEGQNCAFNALFHFITSTPSINDLLEKYPSVDEIKRDILEEFQASSDFYEWDRVELIRGMRGLSYDSASAEKYVKKYAVINALYSMKKTYGVKACGSNQLRQALHMVNHSISENANEQQDVSECFSALLSELSPSQKMQCTITRRYDLGAFSVEKEPIADTRSCISLGLDGKGPFSLKTMLEKELCSEEPGIETITEFKQAPPALYLEVKRYRTVAEDAGGYRIEKQFDPVETPDELEISVADVRHKYELVSFVYHEGADPSKGHYLCGKVIDGKKYLFDDKKVTLLDREWGGYLNKAYLLCYIPKKPV